MTSEIDRKHTRKPAAKQVSAQAVPYGKSEFINFELDKALQAECKAWKMDEASVFAAIEEMTSDGYKFSIKFDKYSDCYACFVFPPDSGHPNSGYILTGRGSSAWKSVKQCLFKHYVVFQGDWASHAGRDTRTSLDD